MRLVAMTSAVITRLYSVRLLPVTNHPRLKCNVLLLRLSEKRPTQMHYLLCKECKISTLIWTCCPTSVNEWSHFPYPVILQNRHTKLYSQTYSLLSLNQCGVFCDSAWYREYIETTAVCKLHCLWKLIKGFHWSFECQTAVVCLWCNQSGYG